MESAVWPAAQVEPVPVGEEVPPVYRWLAQQAEAPILELPMAFTPGGPQLEYQYFSTAHWHTTPDGYSGFVPPKHGQIVYEMERFPSERSVRLLQALDVGYVVVHAGRYSAGRWAAMEEALSPSDELILIESWGGDHVYEVRPRTFDPSRLEIREYFPPRAVAGQPYTAYVIALNEGERSYAIRPTDLSQPVSVWAVAGQETTARTEADVPLVISPAGGAAVVPVSLTAPSQPGAYSLVLSERQGPLGAWTAVGTVDVGDEGADAFPVPARLESWTLPPAIHRGGSLPVALTWRALGKIDAYYSVYVKLLDAEGEAVAGWDGQPQDGEAPTLLWVPGKTVDDVVMLTVPADAPPGEYRVEVGMYRAPDPSSPSGQGLAPCLTLDAEGHPRERIVLGTVRIEP